MSADAAFRRSAASNGTGRHTNLVLAARTGETCNDTCKRTSHKHCNAKVTLWGVMGKSSERGGRVGNFYNYGCNDTGHKDKDEAEKQVTEIKNLFNISYCCCRYN